jgi:hypothetical protein
MLRRFRSGPPSLAIAAAALAALMPAAQGCSNARAGRAEFVAPAPPEPPDVECFPPVYHFTFFETDTRIYRQGAVVKLTPKVDISPAGTQALPPRCVSDWSVTGPARLASDASILTIDEDAPPGSTIEVSFRHGQETVKSQLRVVERNAIVLTGRWSQKEVTGCEPGDPVRELEFNPENRFSVTFAPIETYKDYWGSYSFDPATGDIRFQVAGGNFIPAGVDLEGKAELVDGRLTLRDVFFGSRRGPPQSGCTYRF